MKPFNIDEAIQILETTPAVLNALLRNLPEGTTKPFPDFDRQAQFRESKGKSLSQLLVQFEELRKKISGN